MARTRILAALLMTALPVGGLVGAPVLADGYAGPYLAARSALVQNDFDAATRWFSRATQQDPGNAELVENAMTAALALGDVERAAELARLLGELVEENQTAALVLLGDTAQAEDWEGVIAALDDGRSVGPLFDGLIRAWAQVGLGRMNDAVESFDAVAAETGVKAFGLYHKALALALSGDFEGADQIFSGEDGETIRLTRRGTVAHAEILSQLERNDEALKLIADVFGPELDPALEAIRERLEAGETLPLTIVRNPQDGVAEIYFSIASALVGEAANAYVLLYTQMAEHLRPGHTDAILMSASLLEELGRYELANSVYRMVPEDDPAFPAAEIGRAEALRQAGKTDAAIEVLEQLAADRPDLPMVRVALGDTLRGLERYAEAVEAYDEAIALLEDPQESHWIVYFARGIANERTDRWEKAEADFRRALELRPDQPQVLNYLGYSMVEKGENLDEALAMIEEAVAAEPNAGHIVDSLGWVFYRLGRYEEAVEPLERAAELMPVDPVVNDHLGDAYWAVGRKLEARFQWKRALSFDPEEAEAERIRRKLELGLDAVLAEEGAPPIAVAREG